MTGACSTMPGSEAEHASLQAAGRAPDCTRLTVLTCVGCGAMSAPGSCPGGCGDERRLELVPAAAYDAVCVQTGALATDVDRLEAAVGQLAALPAAPADLDQTLGAAREMAQATLAGCARPPVPCSDDVQPVEAWGCPSCGAIDAPRPCIGVCIREPVQWVPAARLEQAAAHRDALKGRRHALAAVLATAAHLHPRPGRERENWHALRRRAGLLS